MTDVAAPSNTQVEERLRAEPIVWLSSVRPDRRPHLVPVWFHWDGQRVLILSEPNNQKVRNLRANPQVMIAVDDTRGGGDVALVEGTAELLTEPTAAVAPPAYFEKYADLIASLGWTADAMAAQYSQPIRVTPTRFLSW